MFRRREFIALAAAMPAAARAQQQPGAWVPPRPVTIVVPYPAGGPTDLLARLVAQDIARELGQGVVVENVSGGAGAIGTRRVAQGVADGTQLVLGNNQTHATNVSLIPQGGGYDPIRDFAPVAGLADLQHILVVRNELPARDVPEFLALLRAQPGRLSCGSTGQGSAAHLTLELFRARTGLDMTHVAYRGSAPLLQDMLGGHVDVSFATTPTVLEQVRSGRLRALAVASPNRSPHLPQLPMLAEAGVPGVEADAWLALFAPAGVPAPALARYRELVGQAMRKPEVIAETTRLGMAPNLREAAPFAAFLAEDVRRWAEVIRTANVRAE
ncbi:Bug family tripartite tricarboxylate transporter substrate binding protein [Falsiroseomonas oryzae]|uniref:Bug family tripartite tricarboxylate transporter substrate binding protein n=1 Tax=Falsiroseomonas oryzae TaxID=2766473 RepID=UPI0022EB7D06|nr:tripartite tricarboxylate transporter substrate binding protein [Roseomonas sp. MO-31]